MISITDRSYTPCLTEIDDYINNPLFSELNDYMNSEYGALCDIQYSGDNCLLGWNLRYHKAGRTLLRVYPREGYFAILVVVGRKEKERAEQLLPDMSADMRKLYEHTPEGMGQRWLVTDLQTANELYNDVLQLVAIRRKSK